MSPALTALASGPSPLAPATVASTTAATREIDHARTRAINVSPHLLRSACPPSRFALRRGLAEAFGVGGKANSTCFRLQPDPRPICERISADRNFNPGSGRWG